MAAAYRAAKHETTGFTPNFLMLGREVGLPGELSIPQSEESTPAVYVDDLRQHMSKAHEIVRKRMGLAMLNSSHICVMKKSPHFPSDAYMHRKSLYFSYRPRGRPTKVSGQDELNRQTSMTLKGD